ncbi:MAG: type VI secretion system-associated protein TagF [Bacteroidota bacterium]
MQAQPSQAAYYGKTPAHGDFLQHRATTPAWREVDDWIQQGLAHAKRLNRTSLSEAAARAAPVSFLYCARQSEGALTGVMHPSGDKAGRVYPFVVGVEETTPTVTGPWAYHLPIQQASFFEEAERFAARAVRGDLEYWSLADEVDPVATRLRPFGASEFHKRYLQHTPFRTLVEAIWGHFDDSGKYLLFKNITDVLLPFRSEPSLNIAFGMRFPLPSGETMLHAAAFWWELCYRLTQRRVERPSCFWTASAKAADPFLLFFFQPPPPAAIPELLAVQQDDDRICNLTQMGAANAVEAALSIPPHYGTVIESEHISLWEFLCRV